MAGSGSLQTHWLFNTFSSIDHSGNGFKNDRQLILNLFDFDDWILAVYSFADPGGSNHFNVSALFISIIFILLNYIYSSIYESTNIHRYSIHHLRRYP